MSRQVAAVGIVAVVLIVLIGALMLSAGSPLVKENAIAEKWGAAICNRTYPDNLFFVFGDVDAAQYDTDLRSAFQQLVTSLPAMPGCQVLIDTNATRTKLPGALYDPKMESLVYVPWQISYLDQAGKRIPLALPMLQQAIVVQDKEKGERILPTFANPFARSTLKMGQMGIVRDDKLEPVGNVTVQSADRFIYAGTHLVCLKLYVYSWQLGWQGYSFTLASGQTILSDATSLLDNNSLPPAYKIGFWPAQGDQVLPNVAYEPRICYSYPPASTIDFDHLFLVARAASRGGDWHSALPLLMQVTTTALDGDLADAEARADLPFESIAVQSAQLSDDKASRRWVITGNFVPSRLPAAVDRVQVQCNFRLLLSNHREIPASDCGGIDRLYLRTEAGGFAMRITFVADKYTPDEDLGNVSAVELDDFIDVCFVSRKVGLWKAAANASS